MNSLEMTAILEISVIGIAVAQALTILLTTRRERDVSELRELVDEQRLRIAELRAWLAGRDAAQPRLPKPEGEPVREPTTNDTRVSVQPIEPKVAEQPRAAEDEAVQAMKVINWQREIIAGLRAGLKETALEKSAIMPSDLPDTSRPNTPENERTAKAINWLKEETEKARDNVTNLLGPPSAQKIG